MVDIFVSDTEKAPTKGNWSSVELKEKTPSTENGSSKVAGKDEKKNTLSDSRAIITLSKSMFNAGVFSLPYAWKCGGLWATFAMSIVIGSLNYYSAFILVRSSQHIAKKVGREALNYGHFSKRICEMSDIKWLRNHSKLVMITVDMTILLYQLGMCAVAILFISENLTHLFGHLVGGEKHHQMIIFASITLSMILFTNCFTNMRVIYFFAMVSTVFLAVGAAVIIQYTVRQPNHWAELPAYTSFTEFLFMIGQLIYAFEGQTMVLPVENKVRNHETFLAPCGILTITFGICSLFMQFLGFIGYTTYGAETGVTITENVPNDGFYNTVTICLIMQSILGNGMAMYVIFDLFENGFKTKFGKIFPRFPIKIAAKLFRIFFVFVTYLMVLVVPHLDIMCSLVGVTTGTLCALIYPPIFELICFWDDWKKADSSFCRSFKVIRNVAMVSLGIFFIVGGVYANALEFIKAAKKDHLLDFVSATQSYNETLFLN